MGLMIHVSVSAVVGPPLSVLSGVKRIEKVGPLQTEDNLPSLSTSPLNTGDVGGRGGGGGGTPPKKIRLGHPLLKTNYGLIFKRVIVIGNDLCILGVLYIMKILS